MTSRNVVGRINERQRRGVLRKSFLVPTLIVVFSFGSFSAAFSQQAAPTTPTATSQTTQPIEQMAPMRDGVKLSTIIYLPEGKGPWPVVLVRTPYGKASQTRLNGAWTKHGFAFVAQDCRGTFQSEGKYRPFADDQRDGYDTVEWIAKQPWSNGRVGMFGASAMGIAANLAALANPPHLVAAFVMVARSSAYEQSSFMGGVFRKELNEDWLKRQKAEWVLEETFKHQDYDADYYERSEMPRHWEQVQVPIYNYGGWYDIFNQGNIDNFVGLQMKAGALGAGNQKLIMGPWGHGQLEEVKYPANAGIGAFGGTLSTELAMRWFDYWLKGVDNGIMNEPPVRYYVMGEVTGRVTVELWAESDAPDTDFMAKLVDVYPDGTERLVLDSALRARFREGFDHEVFMKKSEVYKFKIDLWSTSLIFNKGHRIAIHVSSSNDPRFDPNPNTGKPLRADKQTQVATNSIHHDRVHPSRALLPVVRSYQQGSASDR